MEYGYHITAHDLFARIYEIVVRGKGQGARDERQGASGERRAARSEFHAEYAVLHELLVLTCHEGIRDTEQAFGNLFSQVDYLCKHHRVSLGEKIAIQEMRRHSNRDEGLTLEDFLYDVRALCLFISAVFHVDIPSRITPLIPTENRPYEKKGAADYRYIRCIIRAVDDHFIQADVEQGSTADVIRIDYRDEHLRYLQPLLHEGMQLNILDGKVENPNAKQLVVKPQLIIVEPDFLVDISSIAGCFKDHGHHPLQYTLSKMQPRANSYATILGNFAGSALDDIINQEQPSFSDTLMNFFKEKALEFSTCPDFDGERFKVDAQRQTQNIQQAVDVLFRLDDSQGYQAGNAILEPSFVCEQLGLQGRVDLMTTDFRLLVEQKSGRNMNIEWKRPNAFGSFQQEPHFVQLLLYYGVLHYNFHLGNNAVDIRLLYSKYPPADGLVVVAYYQQLFHEAIRFRNEVVALELEMARNGFEKSLEMLTPETLNVAKDESRFFHQFLYPQIERVTAPLRTMSALEKAYYVRMMDFIYREQRIGKLGAQEGVNSCGADYWNMPLSEKIETGNIFLGLHITRKEKDTEQQIFNTITLSVPELGEGEAFLPNFRRGDMVYLYAYPEKEEPDVRANILYKGNIKEMRSDELVIVLNNGQQNPNILIPDTHTRYAVEHASSDVSTGGAIRGMHEWLTAPKEKRELLLAQRTPRRDSSLTLSRSYHPSYDEILLKAKQAQDYFLLIGPPGTGKTSMALRFMVEEFLQDDSRTDGEAKAALLLSYTNRAVDEICAMLDDAGIDFLRIGNEYSCDDRFRKYLLKEALGERPRLGDIKRRLLETRIVVGTTSMMQTKPFIFQLKQFHLAIIDEASQILEPQLVGLLAKVGKFILIGDHKQLPAVVQQNERESMVEHPLLLNIGLTNCRNSLFERLINTERRAGREQLTGILRRQGRMHPEIAEFPNRMFYAREQLLPVPLPHQEEKAPYARLLFIDSNHPSVSEWLTSTDATSHVSFGTDASAERTPVTDGTYSDKTNLVEARIVVKHLREVYQRYGKDFNPGKTVGVIVPYRNQISVIRKEIEQLNIPALEAISIDTVERYQGSQRDVIIYSFTVTKTYQLEFLTANCFVEDGHIIDRKLNVALTRARKQLILIGNAPILRTNPLFNQLIDYIKKTSDKKK